MLWNVQGCPLNSHFHPAQCFVRVMRSSADLCSKCCYTTVKLPSRKGKNAEVKRQAVCSMGQCLFCWFSQGAHYVLHFVWREMRMPKWPMMCEGRCECWSDPWCVKRDVNAEVTHEVWREMWMLKWPMMCEERCECRSDPWCVERNVNAEVTHDVLRETWMLKWPMMCWEKCECWSDPWCVERDVNAEVTHDVLREMWMLDL